MIQKGSDPNCIIFEKQYKRGLTPFVLFCLLDGEVQRLEVLVE